MELIPYHVWSESLEKWKQALKVNSHEYIYWWNYVGSTKCSLCFFFQHSIDVAYFNDLSYNCPLRDNNRCCAKEYMECNVAISEKSFENFHKAAITLYNRIRDLNHCFPRELRGDIE
jgi:hypothetical protein